MQHTGTALEKTMHFHDNWKQQVGYHGLLIQRRRLMLSASYVHWQRPMKPRSQNIRYIDDSWTVQNEPEASAIVKIVCIWLLLVVTLLSPLLYPHAHSNFSCFITMLTQGRWKHFSFGQANMLYFYAGLKNGLEWWNGPWNGLWNLHFHSNTQLYCVGICLLTYS